MKKYSLFGLIILMGLGFSSCMKKENYSIIPAITFKSFTVYPDSAATVQISFTDGDGDIGYQNDNTSPYDFYMELLQDSSTGYYVPQFSAGQNDPVMGDTVFLPYHIPYITPAGKNKGLSGQIQVQLGKGSWYLLDKKYYEFRIWIIDRAGHVSNRITTPAEFAP